MISETNHPSRAGDGTAPADVAIVGGGFAGCVAAIALGRDGRKVVLIEASPTIPDVFRAEKISGDQLSLLRELGLLDAFIAASTPATRFINIRGKFIIDRPLVEEYGLTYPRMIALLRSLLPSNVMVKFGQVADIEANEDIQRVSLANGESIAARLVVLATGHSEILRRRLGFERILAHPQPTISVGFSIQPPAKGFGFPALAAYGERHGDGVDYACFFPLGASMRANLFLFSDIRDPRIAALRAHGWPALFELLPGLRPWLQDCEWVGDVAVFPVELRKLANVIRPGVVVIGDAFRTSCPAVGTGLSCALTDIVRLRHHLESWLQTPGMSAEKIALFYADPQKCARDDSAHQEAFKRRDKIKQTSPAHVLRQAAYFARRGLRDRISRFAS
jgi:2-polyprenyl-6-methoxyphenol hydroxylase-like FAD-dependent oxidoreductase